MLLAALVPAGLLTLPRLVCVFLWVWTGEVQEAGLRAQSRRVPCHAHVGTARTRGAYMPPLRIHCARQCQVAGTWGDARSPASLSHTLLVTFACLHVTSILVPSTFPDALCFPSAAVGWIFRILSCRNPRLAFARLSIFAVRILAVGMKAVVIGGQGAANMGIFRRVMLRGLLRPRYLGWYQDCRLRQVVVETRAIYNLHAQSQHRWRCSVQHLGSCCRMSRVA